MKLTRAQLMAIEIFISKELDGQYNQEQYRASYASLVQGSRGWRFLRQDQTGKMRLLMWFQHTHQPGSQEWRPVIILQAVLEHLGLPYQTAIYGTRETPPSAPTGGVKAEFTLIRVDEVPTVTELEQLTDDERDHQEIQESLIIPYNPPPTTGSNHRRPGQPVLAAFIACRIEPITSLF